MDTRKAQIEREWQALTPEHERQLGRVEDTFEAFEAGKTVDPLAIVGAYRSGKTQLIYHLFNISWDRGLPAFYIGDPGAMLTSFEASDEDQLEEWIEQRIEEQLDAYEDGDVDSVEWFPNVDTETKTEFVESHGDIVDSEKGVKTTLLFDEVEQSYRDFIRVMDRDDDNPLRKINDSLQDTIKVWSFGMISAFEFIGEADWGRMKELRIPPLSVADVRELLYERRPEAADLANTIWWLARGRTGLIIKLIDELPGDIEDDPVNWLKDQAEADFKDTRLVNNLWAELDYEEWDPAINALLFHSDGLDSWQIDDSTALQVEDCLTIAVNIVKDEYDFPDTDRGNDARSVLERNIKRVFEGLAIGEDGLFPRFGLVSEAQSAAFIDLIENTIVSFEPAGPTRRLALDALGNAEGTFQTRWVQKVDTRESVNQHVTTAAPAQIRDAFPPIAVNPERVSKKGVEELREVMERGLSLATGEPVDSLVSVRFCPTEITSENELSELVRRFDVTDPVLLIIPDDEEFEFTLDEEARVYERHNLLRVKRIQSNRLWTFVLNLYGRLDAEAIDKPYQIDEVKKNDLLNHINDREVRNTIETLYEQLSQLALEEARRFADRYQETYSLPRTDTLLWDEDRLASPSPYWSTGRFEEATIAVSYLPVFGPKYESNQQYTKLHQHLSRAIEQSLVSGGQSGFGYKEYFQNMFGQSGYSDRVDKERKHYRESGHLAPAVLQTESVLSSFTELYEVSEVISRIDDPNQIASNGDIPVISRGSGNDQAYPLLRALLICGLTKGSDPKIDVAARLEGTLEELKTQRNKIDEYIETINSLDAKLEAPDAADVGEWITIQHDRLDLYRTNLENMIRATEDLIHKCKTNPEAAPIGYHYWFFLEDYADNIADHIHGFESDITTVEISKITDARALFDTVHQTIANSDSISLHFDSREDLLAQVESFGEEIFDLEGHQGSSSISIPEDLDKLQDLNDKVGKYLDDLHDMNEDLDRIDETTATLEPEFEACKEKVKQLLQPKEVTVSE